MKKLQQFTKSYQKELNYHIKDDSYDRCKASLLMNHMLLTTEVSEIAELLRDLFKQTEKGIRNGYTEQESFEMAKAKISEDLGKEISDCIAYLCKLGNFFERDLEVDFYNKMEEVKRRIK